MRISVFLALLGTVLHAPMWAQDRQITSQSPRLSIDYTDKFGTLERVLINEPTSNDFAAFHGEITVRYGSQTIEYKWGGARCPGRNLREMSQSMLASALRDQLKIRVETKNGSGGTLCLVGFELTR